MTTRRQQILQAKAIEGGTGAQRVAAPNAGGGRPKSKPQKPVTGTIGGPSSASGVPGAGGGAFEEVHARDEDGKFTSGPDMNKGPQDDGFNGPRMVTTAGTGSLQSLLNELGYTDNDGYPIKDDGKMGPKTREAILSAMSQLGTRDVATTVAALRREKASLAPAPDKDKDKKKGKGKGRSRRAQAASGDGGDPRNLADGPLTPEDGSWGKPWPKEWGKEPPRTEPGGTRRTEGFADGSALYENGKVWDPDTGEFRLPGRNKGTGKKSLPEYGAPIRHDGVETKRKGHAMRATEHKSMPVTGFKVLDAEQGIVEAFVSVTGIVDEVDDVIEPGAYAETFAKRTPKGVWSHDWDTPISRTKMIKELFPGDPELPRALPDGTPWPAEAGAVKVVTQFNLDTQRGREAFSDVVFYGDEQEWSIGYNVPRGGAVLKDGKRYIKRLDCYEYSPVLFGAMPLAHTASTKSRAAAVFAKADDAGTPSTCAMCRPGAKCADEMKCAVTGKPLEMKSLDAIPAGMDSKAFPGSFESLRDALQAACRATLAPGNNEWLYVRATFPDYVLVTAEGTGANGESTQYAVPYTVTEGGGVELGDPQTVEVSEVIVPTAAPAPASEFTTTPATKGEFISADELSAIAQARTYLT